MARAADLNKRIAEDVESLCENIIPTPAACQGIFANEDASNPTHTKRKFALPPNFFLPIIDHGPIRAIPPTSVVAAVPTPSTVSSLKREIDLSSIFRSPIIDHGPIREVVPISVTPDVPSVSPASNFKRKRNLATLLNLPIIDHGPRRNINTPDVDQ